MLDIGVGGGRTTYHFGKHVKEYVGIDVSSRMIEVCNEKFKDKANHTFSVQDAKRMASFEDDSFDFILFSFNGIDIADETDRCVILREIRRVGRDGAYFAFSSHNYLTLRSNSRTKHLMNVMSLRDLYNDLMGLIIGGTQEPNIVRSGPGYAIVDEGGPSAYMYYIEPAAQIEQLMDLGFERPAIISLRNGKFIHEVERICDLDDLWLYYLTRIRKTG